MKPHLYIACELGYRRGPYAIGVRVGPPTRLDDNSSLVWVGVITSDLLGYKISHLYQESTLGDWCASHWDTPPTDALWWVHDVMGAFQTYVLHSSLNFQNSIFEHRYNLFRNTNDCPKQCELAVLEREQWGVRNVFIPFKESLPDGYKGVRGNFDRWLYNHASDDLLILVIDRYSSEGHLLELMGDN